MALYYYDKHQSVLLTSTTTYYTENSWGSWSSWIVDNSGVSGYRSYGFSSSSGFYAQGVYISNSNGTSVVSVSSTSVTEYENSQIYAGSGNYNWYTRSRTKTATKHTNTTSYYTKGSYITTVVAEDGTYPTNGRHSDGYWYVRQSALAIPSAPSLTFPNGGEEINQIHTITWNHATDSDTSQSSLRYHVQLTTDSTAATPVWTDIVALTNAGVTSYQYDFSNVVATENAKIRIRAYDGYNYGAWDESDAPFKIIHKIKVGEYHAAYLILPIYDPNVGMDEKNQLRTVDKNGNIGCFELVDTTDPAASPFRVALNNGVIKAIAKQLQGNRSDK